MIAVYPGSFDPVTSGHFDIIERASSLFEKVIVLVAVNSSKKPLFAAEERVKILEETCADISNVQVDTLENGLLVEYAIRRDAKVVVKGLRAVSDFEFEFQMALLNRRLEPSIETVFLMTSAEHSFLSSSIVKEIWRLGGDVSGLVPQTALGHLSAKLAQLHSQTTA